MSADDATAGGVAADGRRRPRTRWLSMHVPYACRHSGACCASGWPIPLERARVGRLQRLRSDRSWLLPAPGAPPEVAGVLAISSRGHCVFHRGDCEIQRAFGHDALPGACQHFPREVLIDTRGVSVTLSHYCPTAADLLFAHAGPVEIVDGPPALPVGDPEGLDARDVLPPLLTSGVLLDDEGHSAWEAHVVQFLTRADGLAPEAAVAALAEHLQVLQRWRPGARSLSHAVRSLAAETEKGPVPFSVPEKGTGPFFAAESGVIRRWLAARAFASWMPYQAGGLGAMIASLRLCLATLREQIATIERDAANAPAEPAARLKRAIRRADLLLLHETNREELVRRVRAMPAA